MCEWTAKSRPKPRRLPFKINLKCLPVTKEDIEEASPESSCGAGVKERTTLRIIYIYMLFKFFFHIFVSVPKFRTLWLPR